MEIAAVDLVHRAEIPQILHEHRCLDNAVQRQACLAQHGLQVLQGLMGLGLHTLRQCAGRGVKAQLAAAIDGGTGIDSLRIRAEGGRGVLCCNSFHNLIHSSYACLSLSASGGQTKPRRVRQSCKKSVTCAV